MKYAVNPNVKILRDQEGDYLVSFDEGQTALYLTIAGGHTWREEWTAVDDDYEHVVWQSGEGS